MCHKAILGLISAFLLSGVNSFAIVKQNHEFVQVEEGEVVKLLCTADVEVKACTFQSPSGTVLAMFEGAAYENGRVTKHKPTGYDCGVQISDVKDSDNGNWECTVTAIDERGAATAEKKSIEVVVAVPPRDVTLKIGEVQGLQEYQIKLSEHSNGKAIDVACIATQARPAPTFVWSIGDTSPINGNVVDSTENPTEDGKSTFIQTLKYFPKPGHDKQELKCTVKHPGYRQNQIISRENEAVVKLNVLYPPQKLPTPKVFYDLKEGQSNVIRMKFDANPKPTGIWKLGEQDLAVGAESIDGKFKSSVMEKGDTEGQWVVTLTINKLEKEDSQMVNRLQVTSDEGMADYSFKLALGAKPPAGGGVSPIPVSNTSSSGLAIGVVVVIALIVLVLILVLVARSKGLLCFAAKGGDEHDEEKEAFENVEKGEAAPIVQDSKAGGDGKAASPEKNKISSSSAADEAKKAEPPADSEDRKSNGAHTPVE